jgi:hypothetical protein
MKRVQIVGTIAASLAAITAMGTLPTAVMAQDRHHDSHRDHRDKDDNRQKTKNDWRNLATAAGGVAALGILKKDKTLTFAGAAGALYSLSRYEQDRKSQSKEDRARANIFSQPYFYRDGKRYDRQTVTQHGEKYYKFVRH